MKVIDYEGFMEIVNMMIDENRVRMLELRTPQADSKEEQEATTAYYIWTEAKRLANRWTKEMSEQ